MHWKQKNVFDQTSKSNVRFSSPQIPQRFPPKDSNKACRSCRFSSGDACATVRLMSSSNSDTEQVTNAPRDCRSRNGVQGWFADVDVIDYGEPLRLLSGAFGQDCR